MHNHFRLFQVAVNQTILQLMPLASNQKDFPKVFQKKKKLSQEKLLMNKQLIFKIYARKKKDINMKSLGQPKLLCMTHILLRKYPTIILKNFKGASQPKDNRWSSNKMRFQFCMLKHNCLELHQSKLLKEKLIGTKLENQLIKRNHSFIKFVLRTKTKKILLLLFPKFRQGYLLMMKIQTKMSSKMKKMIFC